MRTITQQTTTLLATLLLTLAFTLTACGESALVGRWDLVEGPIKGNPEDMELLNDGTGIIDESGFKWKTENNRFYMTSNLEGAKSYGYKVQGSTLTFTNDNGTILKYLKRGAKQSESNFTDSRDDKKYRMVKMLDGKVWMAENLNHNLEGSKCYADEEENCQKYGRLYTWEQAKTACPKGWHLSSDAEWTTMTDYVGGDKAAGKKLKAKSGWSDHYTYVGKESGNGTDKYGFSALDIYGSLADWWSSTEYNSDYAYYWGMSSSPEVYKKYNDKSRLNSVRCIKD